MSASPTPRQATVSRVQPAPIIAIASGKGGVGKTWLAITLACAWSGAGRIARVEVSADGGRSWAEAALSEPVQSKALTRFRIPWRWDGQSVMLMSRAVDETGAVQPTHAAWRAQFAPGQAYMYNGIQIWSITSNGEVANA